MNLQRHSLAILIFLLVFLTENRAQGVLSNQIFVQWIDGLYASRSRIPPTQGQNELEKQIGFPIDSIRCTFYFSSSENLRRIWRVYLHNENDRNLALKRLQDSRLFNFSEPVPDLKFFDLPNDLGDNSTLAGGQWYLYRIQALQAWNIQTGSATIKVAVVDDAVETLHSELSGICVPGFDVAQNDFTVDPPTLAHDHGTHIAGLIGANTNNNNGIASLGRGVRILPVKIALDSNPDVVAAGYEGLAWATEQDVDVINMSWGAPDYSQTGLLVTQDALDANITLVAAAGNSNNSVANYPAAYPGVLSVAATTSSDVRSGFTSFGTWVDICAPGSSIWSLAPGDGYQMKSGSSFAAPLVSGLAALLKSANQNLSNSEVESCIISSADKIDVVNPDFIGLLGSGRVNAQQALLCLNSQNLAFNFSLEECIQPGVAICDNWIHPEILVMNRGSEALNFFRIRYILDNQQPRFYEFNGNLEPNDSTVLSLDSLFASPGEHLLRFSLVDELNDGQPDEYFADNNLVHSFRVQHPLGRSLPFTENFESNMFITNNWDLQNESGAFTWEIASTDAPGVGDLSARLPYYLNDGVIGSRDYLTTPSLNFSGYSTINMSYQFAYQPRFVGISDTLIVSISTDCGSTWQRLQTRFDNSTPSLTTRTPFAQFFMADSSSHWCGAGGTVPACASLNLNSFAGLTGVLIRFEGVSSFGNNIYIDNINITGTPSNQAPQASFQLGNAQPVCVGSSVNFVQTSINQPTSFSWLFSGGSPATSNQASPIVTYAEPGIYPVQLVVSNANGSDTVNVSEAVVVEANPSISISTSQDTTCLGVSVSMEASGANSFIWNSNASLSTTFGAQVNASPQNTTTYTVTGYSLAGCSSSANQVITVVSNPPAPSIVQDGFDLTSSPAFEYQWFVNGVLQDSLTTQTITPSQNGNYNVLITNVFGCSSISTVFTVNWVFVETIGADDVLIFPQPATDWIHIKSNEVYDFTLLDLRGCLLLEGKTDAPAYLQHLPSGVYLLRLLDEKGGRTIHFKILKQ